MKAIKKAQTGVKATKDSTAYFKARMNEDYESAARNMNSPKYSEQAFKRAKQHGDDYFRQANKGKKGYDANGFPIKKKKAKSGVSIAKDGKWMQKAAASIKRRGTEGKCTPITKPGCTGKAKALAKTFKKIAKSNKKK
jgi:hypothetical protein